MSMWEFLLQLLWNVSYTKHCKGNNFIIIIIIIIIIINIINQG